MATPQAEDVGQIGDIQALALAQDYFVMSESSAWKDLMERLQGLVDKSEQELFSDMGADEKNIMLLKTRWQQRKLTLAAIREIVNSQLQTRESILEEMRNLNEHYPDNA